MEADVRALKDYERFYVGDVDADGQEPGIEVSTIDSDYVNLYQDGEGVTLTRKQAADMIVSLTKFLETPTQ
jgi:hypothetical protein